MWQIKNSEYIYKSRWLTVRKDEVRTEKGVDIDDFYVLEYPTWVNVVAITDEGKYIIERQYRHGIGQEVYEICSGVCQSGGQASDYSQQKLLRIYREKSASAGRNRIFQRLLLLYEDSEINVPAVAEMK